MQKPPEDSGEPNLAITPLSQIDRTEQISKSLSDYIARAGLRRGDRLPTERKLMEALGVGRSTIREAIGRFRALGIVESRIGSGTYLLKPISATTIQMPLSLDAAGLRDALTMTLEVRRGIEIEAAALAARRRDDRDLEILERRLDEMEREHIARGTSGRQDLAFHLAVYDATHNPLFRQLLEQMREVFEKFWDKPFDRADFAQRSFPYHRTLFNAIAAQDSDAARREIETILTIVEEDIKDMS